MSRRETQEGNTAVCEGVVALAVSVVPFLSVHVDTESRRSAAALPLSCGSSIIIKPTNPKGVVKPTMVFIIYSPLVFPNVYDSQKCLAESHRCSIT